MCTSRVKNDGTRIIYMQRKSLFLSYVDLEIIVDLRVPIRFTVRKFVLWIFKTLKHIQIIYYNSMYT